MVGTLIRKDSVGFDIGRFPAHGRLQIEAGERLLHFRCRGPFNEEWVKASARAILAAIPNLHPDHRFVELLEFHDSLLMSPSTLAALTRLVDDAVARGFVPLATVMLVADDVEGRSLMLQRLVKCWGGSRPLVVCADATTARSEVDRRLAELAHSVGVSPELASQRAP